MAVTKAELKNIKSLGTKKGRRQQGRFAVGGVRLLEEALKFRFMPLSIIYTGSLLTQRGGRLISRLEASKVTCRPISSRELKSVSDTKSSQGIMGTFQTPTDKLSKLYKPSYRRLLLCDEITDPGNLGTLARSAMAFGFDMILTTGKAAELYSPKVVRSSAGALFGLPVSAVSYAELKDFCSHYRVTLLAADAKKANMPRKTTELRSFKNNKTPIVLAVGSEATGLSTEVRHLADSYLSISHSIKVESLNAAVAGSILMQQFYRMQAE